MLIPVGAAGTILSARRAGNGFAASVSYELTLRHDVPNYTWFWIAVGLLADSAGFVHHPRAQRSKRSAG